MLAVVRGPDGGACPQRQDAAGDAWVALWNGDEAPPDATGMVAAIVAPLAAGNVPVWVAASCNDGDFVLISFDQLDERSELLHRAGHRVIG